MAEPRAPRHSVGVDARGIDSPGIGRYLREILAVLFEDARFDRVSLLGDAPSLRRFLQTRGAPSHVTVEPYAGGYYSPRSQAAWLAHRLRGARADVWFMPHYDVPLVGLPRRSVVTVHDLIHFQVPEAFAAWRRAGAHLLLRRAVRQAGRILAVSRSTRDDLVAWEPAAASKTTVIPNGVSACFRPWDGEGAGLGIADAGPFLLCVGSWKPHKNLATAVEALALLRRGRPELRLVLAGRDWPEREAVRGHASRLGVASAVVELEDATDEQLRALYSRCEALLFPSLYEGFGLPVLEAMACGAPVVASNRSSIPEVVGDAGLLVDPRDAAAMAAAVERLRAHPELRADLSRRARERAAGFRWERTARETLRALHEVASGSADAEAGEAAGLEVAAASGAGPR